jgi:excisionase family DNA binding protein
MWYEARSSLPIDDPYLTIKDICSELTLSHETVRQWIIGGRLPYLKAGRQYRVRRSDLERMLASGGAPQTEGQRGAESFTPNPMSPGAGLDAGFSR